MYECKILADSISPHGERLTTFSCTFPRIILPEILTHRTFSRNTSSSRAIPVNKQIEKVKNDPFIPKAFGKNQKGMQAQIDVDELAATFARKVWKKAIKSSIKHAQSLVNLEVHKQLANRVIEPYTWTTQIITATDWDNFFKLRCAEDAQPEIRTIAEMMKHEMAVNVNKIVKLNEYQWHLPLLSEEELIYVSFDQNWNYWKKVSIGRCARVSYLTHDGLRDPNADIALCDRLYASKHLSPFEHVARPFSDHEWTTINSIRNEIAHRNLNGFTRNLAKRMEYVGNLHGWVSHRMELEAGI